jgi:tetratricopeptide (TPR) repeat protein
MRDAGDLVPEDTVRSTQEASAAPEAPGALSRLLLELAQAPEEDLAASWQGTLKPGEAVGRYQIREEIGRGGFGAVYEAFDPELGRAVALKTLRPGRTRRELTQDWIKKEAEAVARLDHPGIVTVHDVGTCPSGPYLVMELLRGQTLQQRLEKGPLPAGEALRVAEEMARALAHAHHRGVLHRDLKPGNVFLTEDGRVKLLDFGLAHLLGREGGSSGGTPAYMAPEQARGEPVDERADVYAAGMVLGEMLTGRRPLEPVTPPGPSPVTPTSATEALWPEGRPGQAESRVPAVESRSPDLAGLPRAIVRVVAPSLSADRAGRPRDGAAWLQSLLAARRSLERPRTLRRVAVVAGIGTAVGLAVAGLATWRVWERQIPGGRPTVAVADFANETGDRDLDAISGLLTTSLEQGTQLRVLTRGRMLDVLKQMGKGDAERIDEPLAREVGRQTRANALLLASIRRFGEGFVVEMRALDPLHDEYLFTVSDRAPAKEAVFDLVDRLGAAARRKLGAPGTQTAPPPRVASITTSNTTAWRLLFQARQAFDRGEVQKARDLAREAVQLDPDFALARFVAVQAAWWLADPGTVRWFDPGRASEARVQVEELGKAADRLPEKERLSLSAMRASLDERWEELFRIRDEIVEAYPLDKEAHYLAGEARVGRFMDDAAIPFFQRALELDPGYGIAVQSLARSLASVGAADQHLDWIRQQAAIARDEREMHWLATALLAAGREDEAVALYRKMLATHGGHWPPHFYAMYLFFYGRFSEVEAAVQATLDATAAASPAERREVEEELRGTRLGIASNQGRLREYWELSEGSPILARNPTLALMARVWQAGARRDMGSLEKALEEYDRSTAIESAAIAGLEDKSLAVSLAMQGHLDLACERVARAVADAGFSDLGPHSQRILNALAAGCRGATAEAERSVSTPAITSTNYELARLAAEFAFARGDCDKVIRTLESLSELRWCWYVGALTGSRPRVLHQLATCYERTGDLAKARERNDELLRRWARADPDLHLLIEAKALKARLEAR